MKKQLLLLAGIITLLFFANVNTTTQTISARTALEPPPIPKESPHTEKVAIVTTTEDYTEEEIHAILKPYPDITLRHVFKHALSGFSVKGKVSSLQKLVKTNKVEIVSPVNTYKAEQAENIKIIGGDEVRGYFDKNNNRLTGKGIKIGVIDTGIDYNHPDLHKTYKGGKDLVDGDSDPMETNTEGLGTIHGTHVAGIIAANGSIQGVAPGAEIYAYRALGPGGTGTTEQVLAAIEEAVKDRMDIINLSLGNEVNGPDLPISMAIDKAVEKGIVAVTSSGNSGPNKWTVGSPGTATKGISVGASTPPLKSPYLDIQGMNKKIRLEPMAGAEEWKLDRSYQLHDGGLGDKESLQGAKGKIALIQRGEITFMEKAQNALEAGAIAVIIYNNTNGQFFGNLEGPVKLPVASVSKKDGKKLKRLLSPDSPFVRTIIIEEKDFLALFSSRGPVTSSWEIKPDVVAPGVAINSTIPGGYMALQGTSMAAPHVAGACALIKQAHPDWEPEKIKAALMNTAIPIFNEKGKAYRTIEQGAGRIQIEDAIRTESIVMPGSLHFSKFVMNRPHHKEKRVLTIVNEGNSKKTYTFTAPKEERGIEWELPLSLTLEAKETKKVEIGLTVNPKELKKKIYDHYLGIQAGPQKIRLPYICVIEEPDYPRIMGFNFAKGDKEGVYRYEVYLPGGAEEFAVALFDSDSYRFIGFLDSKREVGQGMLKEEIKEKELPPPGSYIAKIIAKKAGQTDTIESPIYIP